MNNTTTTSPVAHFTLSDLQKSLEYFDTHPISTIYVLFTRYLNGEVVCGDALDKLYGLKPDEHLYIISEELRPQVEVYQQYYTEFNIFEWVTRHDSFRNVT